MDTHETPSGLPATSEMGVVEISDPVPGQANRIRVLVVDDEPRVRKIIQAACKSAGLVVISAANGLEAMEQLTLNDHVDVVVTDVMMPEMAGWQLARTM